MKKIFKTLLPIASVGCLSACLAPATSCGDKTIAAIVITSKPAKLSYHQGEYLDLTGLKVKVVKKDGTQEETTNYTTSIKDKSRLNDTGKIKIDVNFNSANVSDSFEIDVGEAVISKLEITTQPKNAVYSSGETLSLEGMVVKATKTNDEVITDYKNYTASPAEGTPLTTEGRVDITLTADGVTTQTAVIVTTAKVLFADASWETISDWTYCLEIGVIDEEYFCDHFYKTGTTPFTDLNDFIGQSKYVTINNKLHEVKVIGVNHDTIDSDLVSSGTKATFTFQFFNKITTSDSKCLKTIYNQNGLADYVNSQLRYNLNKTGNGAKIINWDETSEVRCLFEMLPQEFENYVWKVKKEVACKDSTSTFVKKQYSDRIFLPTVTEYAQTDLHPAKFLEEGKAYTYWTNHNNPSDRIIKYVDATTDKQTYYTASPVVGGSTILSIKDDGEFGAFDMSIIAEAIAPAFCI